MKLGILKNKFFVISLLIITLVGLRLLVLYSACNVVMSEEGVRGILAKHILEGNNTQAHLSYIHLYGLGSVVSSFMAVPLFLLFGVSTISLRLVPLIFSIGILVILFTFTNKFFSRKVALLTSLLYIFSIPSYFRYSLYCVANHHDILFFDILIFFVFFSIFFNSKRKALPLDRYGYWIILGVLSGLAIAYHVSAFIFVLVIMFYWYLFDKLFFLRVQFLIFVVSFTVGISPLLYAIFSGYSSPLMGLEVDKFLFTSSYIAERFIRIKDLFFYRIPDSFNFELIPFFNASFINYLYYFVVVISVCFLIWLNRESLKNVIKGVIPSTKHNVIPEKINPESLLLVFPLFYSLLYSFSQYSSDYVWRDHYAMVLYPFFYIFISLFIIKLFEFNFLGKIISVVLAVSIILISLFGNINFYINGDRWSMSGLRQLISELLEKDIHYVYTYYDAKWPLVFESKEKIIASCRGIWSCSSTGDVIYDDCHFGERYDYYEQAVDRANRYAYVFTGNHKFGHIDIMDEYLSEHDIRHKKRITAQGFVIYYEFSRLVRPENINFAEEWKRRHQ